MHKEKAEGVQANALVFCKLKYSKTDKIKRNNEILYRNRKFNFCEKRQKYPIEILIFDVEDRTGAKISEVFYILTKALKWYKIFLYDAFGFSGL